MWDEVPMFLLVLSAIMSKDLGVGYRPLSDTVLLGRCA